MVRLPLRESISSKASKQIYVEQMFATIAPRYDLVTRLLSLGADQRWKKKLVELTEVASHYYVLDLACGTGDITFLLARRVTSGRVYGVDVTPGMLEVAKRRNQRLGFTNIQFELADVMKLNYSENSFDRITTGYGLRNFSDIPEVLNLILRLLKPGGRFLSLDFGKPAGQVWRALYLGYLQTIGQLLGWGLHGDADVYRYIPESLRLYPAQRGIQALMDAAAFVDTGYRDILGGALAINFGGKSILRESNRS